MKSYSSVYVFLSWFTLWNKHWNWNKHELSFFFLSLLRTYILFTGGGGVPQLITKVNVSIKHICTDIGFGSPRYEMCAREEVTPIFCFSKLLLTINSLTPPPPKQCRTQLVTQSRQINFLSLSCGYKVAKKFRPRSHCRSCCIYGTRSLSSFNSIKDALNCSLHSRVHWSTHAVSLSLWQPAPPSRVCAPTTNSWWMLSTRVDLDSVIVHWGRILWFDSLNETGLGVNILTRVTGVLKPIPAVWSHWCTCLYLCCFFFFKQFDFSQWIVYKH